MGEEKLIITQETKQVHWASISKDEDLESMESSSINGSRSSLASSLSSSDELADDASSPSTSSNSPTSRGPLYELDELMAQLPIKKGLSKFYAGKSRTFASLASVTRVEDLAKESESSYSRRMRPCKSYGGNLNRFGPKATITKRSPRRSISPS